MEGVWEGGIAWYGTHGFFVRVFPWWGYPDWFCEACGSPQAGLPVWAKLGGRPRCRACGPGDGWVPCPATHGGRPCVLCRGEGWIGEAV